MPTNKELADDIHAIQPDIDVTGMNNKDLAALLKDLRAAQELSAPTPEKTSGEKYVESRQPEIEKMASGAMAIYDALKPPAAQETTAPAPPDLSGPNDAEPEEVIPSHTHVVVDGRSITSRRGMINGGKPISADDLSGGEEALKVLIAKGFVNELKTTSGA